MATLSTEEVIDLLDEEPIMEDSDDDLGLELSDSEER